MFKKQNAFTLIELMVTLVVLGVVLGVALPSFKSQILQNKAVVLSDNFITALNFVRSEAVKQATPARAGTTAKFVTLCPSINGAGCSTNPDDWSKAIIAVVDSAATESAAAPVVTNTTDILKVWTRTDEKAWVDVRQINDGEVVKFIRYTSSGKLAIPGKGFSGLNIKTKMKDNGQDVDCILNSARLTKISIVGQTSTSSIECW